MYAGENKLKMPGFNPRDVVALSVGVYRLKQAPKTGICTRGVAVDVI